MLEEVRVRRKVNNDMIMFVSLYMSFLLIMLLLLFNFVRCRAREKHLGHLSDSVHSLCVPICSLHAPVAAPERDGRSAPISIGSVRSRESEEERREFRPSFQPQQSAADTDAAYPHSAHITVRAAGSGHLRRVFLNVSFRRYHQSLGIIVVVAVASLAR